MRSIIRPEKRRENQRVGLTPPPLRLAPHVSPGTALQHLAGALPALRPSRVSNMSIKRCFDGPGVTVFFTRQLQPSHRGGGRCSVGEVTRERLWHTSPWRGQR